jgi:hypothetical protein
MQESPTETNYYGNCIGLYSSGIALLKNREYLRRF